MRPCDTGSCASGRYPRRRGFRVDLDSFRWPHWAGVQKADLPAVVAQMKQRFDREAPSRTKELWSATYILMGLRYERAMVQSLLRGVLNMKESVTYQAILEEGKAEGKAEGEGQGQGQGRGRGSPQDVAAARAATGLASRPRRSWPCSMP